MPLFVGLPLPPKRIGDKPRLGRPHFEKVVFFRLLRRPSSGEADTKLCTLGSCAEGGDQLFVVSPMRFAGNRKPTKSGMASRTARRFKKLANEARAEGGDGGLKNVADQTTRHFLDGDAFTARRRGDDTSSPFP